MSALARGRSSSFTRRGGSDRSAGSENELVTPCNAASATSIGNDPASRNVNETTAASASATMITRFGPKRSIGTPASGPSSAGGSAQDRPSTAIAPGPASKRKLAKPQSATIAHQDPIP